MSLIPQRKHTPEELAALRAQEFPQLPLTSSEQSTSTKPEQEVVEAEVASEAPRYTPPVKRGTFHGFEGLRPEAAAFPQSAQATAGQNAELPPARELASAPALRKTPPQKHGTTHAFSGLRPEAASEISAGQSAPSAALPQRKHDENEIMEMRRRDMFHTRPPVQHILSLALNPILAGMLYTIAIASIYLTFHYWNAFPPQKFYAPAAGCCALLLASLLIYWKKPRGRHHAAFLAGIALILASFVILLTTNHHAP
jgi:hypothetical protein